MATRVFLSLVCDLCDGDDMVETHVITVDGSSVECEACPSCWQKTIEGMATLAKVGRRPTPKKVSRRKDVFPFPGEAWSFTAHALVRLGERHLDPSAAALAAEHPTMTHPGLQDGTEVRTRDNLKVVVAPSKRLILTVSKRGEEAEHVA